jgi:sulfur relay (sulfurtransferase) DsrC/TusE family protein
MNKQLKMGIKVELEHAKTFKFIKDYYKKNKKFPNNKVIATRISKDHLKESSVYYSKLKKARL